MGDSRIYQKKGDSFLLITDDHTPTGEMFRADYIKIHEIPETAGSNTLTKHLGHKAMLEADFFTLDSLESCFLICCDGVWSSLHTKEGLYAPENYKNQEFIEHIVDEALKRDGSDNCSALLIDIQS